MATRILVPALLLVAGVSAAQTPNTPTVLAPTPGSAAVPAVAPAADAGPRGFTYDPNGRRDPFVSLLQRGSDSDRSAPSLRAAGLSGLGASEVTLKGTLASRGGYVAIMQGVDSKTYIVRPGERLMDGTVRTITPDSVVILQQVKDPLSLEQEREVRKTLRQTEEAK